MAKGFPVLLREEAGAEAILVVVHRLDYFPTKPHGKSRLGRKPVPSLHPSSDGAGQWAGPEDVTLPRGTGGKQPGRSLAEGLSAVVCGEEEEQGGAGGASLNGVSVHGEGAGRVQAEGPCAFPRHALPSFLLSFPTQFPLGMALKGEDS